MLLFLHVEFASRSGKSLDEVLALATDQDIREPIQAALDGKGAPDTGALARRFEQHLTGVGDSVTVAPVALGLLAQAFPPTWTRDVGLGFYSAATQIIPVFFIALLVELLALGGHIKPLGQRVADTIDVGTKARDRSGRTVEDLQELSTGLETERNELDADIEKARELWDEQADLDRRASELRMKARQSEEGPQPDDAASGGLDEARRIRDEGNRLAGKIADLQREVTEREDKARETQREGDSVLEDAGKLVPEV